MTTSTLWYDFIWMLCIILHKLISMSFHCDLVCALLSALFWWEVFFFVVHSLNFNLICLPITQVPLSDFQYKEVSSSSFVSFGTHNARSPDWPIEVDDYEWVLRAIFILFFFYFSFVWISLFTAYRARPETSSLCRNQLTSETSYISAMSKSPRSRRDSLRSSFSRSIFFHSILVSVF